MFLEIRSSELCQCVVFWEDRLVQTGSVCQYLRMIRLSYQTHRHSQTFQFGYRI